MVVLEKRGVGLKIYSVLLWGPEIGCKGRFQLNTQKTFPVISPKQEG